MARVVVHVMPKTEILDPQGQAIVGALGRLGHAGITDVRQGKRFELEVDDTVSDETLEHVAETLLPTKLAPRVPSRLRNRHATFR